ncbi:hypothetical protein FKP32DRAFT_2189 [Trametes sanguinea]|nr:hypothetical protein FKP32DRAFT_2189 [Trametes sanguinea]
MNKRQKERRESRERLKGENNDELRERNDQLSPANRRVVTDARSPPRSAFAIRLCLAIPPSPPLLYPLLSSPVLSQDLNPQQCSTDPATFGFTAGDWLSTAAHSSSSISTQSTILPSSNSHGQARAHSAVRLCVTSNIAGSYGTAWSKLC